MKRCFSALHLLLPSLLMLVQPLLAQTSVHNYIVERVMCGTHGTDAHETVHYYDGLGHPVETVATAASPSGGDIVTVQQYDGAGRVVRSWNAAPCSGAGGSFVAPDDFADTARGFYADTHPFASTVYEPSPLGRAVMQTGPGQAWHERGRGISTAYMLNNAGVDSLSCRIVKACDTRLATDTAVSVTVAEPYPTGMLHVLRTTDEEGFVTLVFTDKAGRTVLERRSADGGKWADTYYAYDPCGNLTAVLPPAFSAGMSSQTFSSCDGDAARYCYFYLYDREGRCRAKKLPGCSWHLFVHDIMGRVVYSQDGMQRQRGEWSFTLSDAFGHECVTGLCRCTLDVLGQTLPDFSLCAVRDRMSSKLPGYRAVSPQGMELRATKVLSVKFYDDYSFVGEMMAGADMAAHGTRAYFPDSVFSYRPLSGYGKRYEASAKGMLTGECHAVLGGADGAFTASSYYYDTDGRVVQSCRSNTLGGHDIEWTGYDFTGNVTAQRIEHTPGGITEKHTFTYDCRGRLLTGSMSVDGGAAVTIASNAYDETGRLASMGHAGNKTLSTAYSYNVRSWPTSITGSLFSERLYYNDAPESPRYDGCIARADWIGSNNMGLARYSYDTAKRLTWATYWGKYSEDYSTQYAYDIMGNLTMLVRRGRHDGYGTYSYLDILNCAYDGNRLRRVSDSMMDPTYKGTMQFSDRYSGEDEYAYDSDGRMTEDRNRGMTVSYNAIGLPQDITLPGGTIRYRYTSDGQKVGATYSMPLSAATSVQATQGTASSAAASSVAATSVTAIYSGGIAQDNAPQGTALPQVVCATSEYCGNLIYRDGKPHMLLFDGGYVSFAQGRAPQYVFYLRDHLGSNRMAVATDGTVVEQNHYYPYGALMDNSDLDGVQPFKYSGKELDRMLGLDLIDYGARWYDPVVPHWMTVDPLCEVNRWVSPYVFCTDNPINMRDYDGRNPIYNTDGNLLGTTKDGFAGIIYVYKGVEENIDWGKYDMDHWLDGNNGYDMDLVTYDQMESVYTGTEKHASFAKNVINSIAKHFDGTKLFGDRTFTMSSLRDGEIKFTESDASNFSTNQKHDGQKTRITFHGETQSSYEGTVENFASSMLIHEWYSHGEYGIGDYHVDKGGNLAPNHHKAYLNVEKDLIFYPKTTSKYKEFVKAAINHYISKKGEKR